MRAISLSLVTFLVAFRTCLVSSDRKKDFSSFNPFHALPLSGFSELVIARRIASQSLVQKIWLAVIRSCPGWLGLSTH